MSFRQEKPSEWLSTAANVGKLSALAPWIDIWQGDLEAHQGVIEAYSALLSQSERLRMDGIKHNSSRNNYVLVRIVLRELLAAYVQIEPQSLQFEQAEFGKLRLIGYPIYFNLSHSANKLVIAVANRDHIGVDIEAVKLRKNMFELARGVLSTTEFVAWASLEYADQLMQFYALWTKKEAFVKAVGRGIALGLDRCEIDMPTGTRFRAIPSQYGRAEDWKILAFKVASDFSGALVAPNLEWVVGEGRFCLEGGLKFATIAA
jgi:4'-phosphopantetheinyl transferase